jgi:hypothetical protein
MTDIILSGTEETLKPIITALIGVYQLLEDKDIGQFVGEPLIENVRATPHTSRLKLILSNVKHPPLKAPIGGRLIMPEYQVPNINPRKINWQVIKDVCGGKNGFMWGSFLATANLDIGRQMQAYGASAKDADNMLNRMLSLTTGKVVTRGITELKKEGMRAKGKGMYRENARVYPIYCIVINSKRIEKIEKKANNEEKNSKKRSKLRGNYIEKGTGRIPLYTDKEPTFFTENMRKALDFSDS